jgi:hypothetical protein
MMFVVIILSLYHLCEDVLYDHKCRQDSPADMIKYVSIAKVDSYSGFQFHDLLDLGEATTSLLLRLQTSVVHKWFDSLRVIKNVDEVPAVLPLALFQPDVLRTASNHTDCVTCHCVIVHVGGLLTPWPQLVI